MIRSLYIVFIFVGFIISALNAQSKMNSSPSEDPIAKKTAEMTKYTGFQTFYWDAKAGKIWLEIDKWDQEFIYANYLSQGIGSNDIGLDRGQIGGNRIIKFQRHGSKILLIEPNYGYRAITDNPDERQAVHESFAQSVLWGFKIEAEDKNRVLIDASSFLLRDAHDVSGSLLNAKQGKYQLEPDRSVLYAERTKNFPKNTEFDVLLTFSGKPEGWWIRSVVPSPESVTIHQHHSFVQLPDNNYKPRENDPRAGYFGISYQDYATPINSPLVKRFISRHRLQKKDKNAKISEPHEPIIYYLDRGAPEPIRSALMEGASWWNHAFEACGYENAFQVKMLPAEADPLDVRYNVIQWVHRSTRGWSYGGTIIDPRTGEILKGHVSLGSLRIRQDYLIAEGIISPYSERNPETDKMLEMALARIRQLSAHEVGHTLGLAHNYSSSAADRASVMDYPHPYVTIKHDGSLDLSEAYSRGVGLWDKTAIAYGYSDFPDDQNEKELLNTILKKSMDQGLVFLSDSDARPAGSAHPTAHLWDNGKNAVDELNRVMEVRKIILRNFSEENIKQGQPMATLAEVLVPMYFFHRYQVEAAAKVLGGAYYTYALRGDGQTVLELVTPDEQRRSLSALLQTLTPEALLIPDNILVLLPPDPGDYLRLGENFDSYTGLTFDPLAAAESAAQITLSFLLHPQRAARLVEYNARNSHNPGFSEIINQLLANTWMTSPRSGYEGEIQKTVENLVLKQMIQLATDPDASGQVKSIINYKIEALKNGLKDKIDDEENEGLLAHYFYAVNLIERYQSDPDDFKVQKPVNIPAGSPIGTTIFQ